MILKAKVNFYMYIFQNNAHGYKMEVLYLYFLTLTHKSPLLLQFAASKYSKLDPNKGCGHDMIIIRMIKLCGRSIFKPLENACKS